MIIGLSGKAQSGKDTVGEYLVKKYGFVRVASADALKRIARNIFGWNGIKDEKGRTFLQDLGCSVRGYNKNYWINATMDDIMRHKQFGKIHFVITDVRFLNEAEILKSNGALILRINRDGIQKFDHVSETELDNYDFDMMIYNNSTIRELYDHVDFLIANKVEVTINHESK